MDETDLDHSDEHFRAVRAEISKLIAIGQFEIIVHKKSLLDVVKLLPADEPRVLHNARLNIWTMMHGQPPITQLWFKRMELQKFLADDDMQAGKDARYPNNVLFDRANDELVRVKCEIEELQASTQK